MAQPQPLSEPLPELEVISAHKSSWRLVLLYSGTLFISALLLFSVQPIFAKMLLPRVGGAPAVWNTAMLFYQAALLAGYGYAHWASQKLSAKAHLISHLALLALPFAVLPFGIPSGSAPSGSDNPVPWLLVTMALGIGLPFFVVSSTGPLLQRWFSRTGDAAGADPYFLYAASNLGSMLGLLGYPFLIEPNLRLTDQSKWWAVGYGVLALAIVGCAATVRKSTWTPAKADATAEEEEAPTWCRRMKWIVLAFVPSSLMLGVTQYITTDVAAVPLLWVVPLALYLLTFTIVFAKRPLIPHSATLVLMPVSLGTLVTVMALQLQKPMLAIVGVHLAAFFFAAMLCHGEMAKDRPPVRFLTEFYLWMSVGGVLGGFFNAIVAPVVFPLVLEYPLALALAAVLYPGDWKSKTSLSRVWDVAAPALLVGLLFGAIWLEKRFGLTSSTQSKMMLIVCAGAGTLLFLKRPLRFGIGIAAMLAVGMYFWAEKRRIVYLERSFFGVTRVEDTGGKFYSIFHGTTLHGMQKTDPKQRMEPVSYYFPNGPIGTLLTYMHRPPQGKYAVVGLGSGTLATYGKAGETWTYYEIDPVVEKVARDDRFFTFLKDSPAEVKVVLGDARIQLQNTQESYDLLMLDAYSSDAVPVHLLTKEAASIYLSRLTERGMIAFHISNKHLDLQPVVHEICRSLGLVSYQFRDLNLSDEERLNRKAASDWIVAARDESVLAPVLAHGDWKPTHSNPGVGLWTDDFSSIWTVYGVKRSDLK